MSSEVKIELPLQPVKAVTKSPKELIIFSKPKVGKTTLLAGLPDCLILDFEDGSDYVEAMKLKVRTLEELKQIGKAIKEAGNPYKYIAIDTVTALEEFCIGYAEELYSKSSMGKNWFTDGKPKYGTILNMPNGAGYPWLPLLPAAWLRGSYHHFWCWCHRFRQSDRSFAISPG